MSGEAVHPRRFLSELGVGCRGRGPGGTGRRRRGVASRKRDCPGRTGSGRAGPRGRLVTTWTLHRDQRHDAHEGQSISVQC